VDIGTHIGRNPQYTHRRPGPMCITTDRSPLRLAAGLQSAFDQDAESATPGVSAGLRSAPQAACIVQQAGSLQSMGDGQRGATRRRPDGARGQ
jgi:hypothetical protein